MRCWSSIRRCDAAPTRSSRSPCCRSTTRPSRRPRSSPPPCCSPTSAGVTAPASSSPHRRVGGPQRGRARPAGPDVPRRRRRRLLPRARRVVQRGGHRDRVRSRPREGSANAAADPDESTPQPAVARREVIPPCQLGRGESAVESTGHLGCVACPRQGARRGRRRRDVRRPRRRRRASAAGASAADR